MPPKSKNNKPKADNKPQQKPKDAFTPTPAPVQQQSGMSYMSALKTKEAAAQQQAPVVAQVVAPAPKPATPAKQPAAQQQASPAPAAKQQPQAQAQQQAPAAKQQEQPAASTGFSYKSALQKPAAPKPAPVVVPQPAAEQKPAVIAPVEAVAEKPAKKDEAAPADAQAADAESPVSPQQQGFKKVGRSNKSNDKSKLKFNEKLNIPPGAAAYIIGRGGANVKRINETSGARVTVKDAHVSIQANLKQQFTNAKRQVLELLKAYLTRVQTQAREFNIIMPDDNSDPDALKLCMNPHEGPLSEWIVRDATPKQKEQPKKEAAPAAAPVEGAEKPAEEAPAAPAVEEDSKPIFYTTSILVDKSLEQEEEEVDEEQDTLNRMVEYTSGSKNDNKDKDDKPVQGASISLIGKSVLNETFTSFADKLAEEHEREEHFRSAFKEEAEEDEKSNEEKPKADEKKKEHNKNSVDAEVNIGKKLFYINPEAKKKRKNKEKSAASLDKVEDVPLSTFLDYKFGYSHKFHMAFNYALSADDIAKIEGALKAKASIKVEKKQTLSARVILGFRKANVTLTVVEPSEGNLATVKIADYYEKSSRFSLIDFLRPKKGVLDFRIIGRYYSKVEAPQTIVDHIAKRVRFDKEKNEFVVAEEVVVAPVVAVAADAAAADKKAVEEKKPERFNVYLDRVKSETLYTEGKFTVSLSQVKDIVKEKNNNKKEGEHHAHAEGKQEEQHEEEDAKAEKKIVESLEASVRCSGLRYDGVTTVENALNDTRATMEFITSLLESVNL